MTSSAGRRITTISIETSDPVAYVTSRPDPLTLIVDLRDVDASDARRMLLGATTMESMRATLPSRTSTVTCVLPSGRR
jgi:hypothetical protein